MQIDIKGFCNAMLTPYIPEKKRYCLLRKNVFMNWVRVFRWMGDMIRKEEMYI
jgi:hypothetical protein